MACALDEFVSRTSENRRPLWIDAWDYGRQLIGKGGHPPWGDIGAFVAYHRQLQSLVDSDFVVVEVSCFYRAWLDNNPALLTSMRAKSRTGFALRTLLADEASRHHLREIVDALTESYPDRPVLLSMPSPRNWLQTTNRLAKPDDATAVSWEQAESAAMYMADYLRNFASCDLSGLFLKDGDGGPQTPEQLQTYQPVVNVSEHYRWQLVLDACAENLDVSAHPVIKFILGQHTEAGDCPTLSLDCWPPDSKDGVKADRGLWYLSVPKDMQPEKTLDLLAAIRGTT